MRRGLLFPRVAFVAVAAALLFASDGSGAGPRTVVITASGPSPSTVRISADGAVLFVNQDSVAHTVVLRQNPHARWTCSLGPAGESPSGSDQCTYGAGFVSSHAYSVDGRFPGTVIVVGLARSVSLTARAHSVGLGSQLKLHGQITFDNQSDPVCGWGRFTVFLLARNDRSQPFKRIAIVPATPTKKNMPATNNRCTYVWQRNVRPGVATAYIARVTEGTRIWKPATSRPFSVLIRP